MIAAKSADAEGRAELMEAFGLCNDDDPVLTADDADGLWCTAAAR